MGWAERNQCAGSSSFYGLCACGYDPGNNKNVEGRCLRSGRLTSSTHILSAWYLRLRFVLWHVSSHWQMVIKVRYMCCYDCYKVPSWCSTHPLEVPSDAELIEELSFLLSQSLTSRLRIYAEIKTSMRTTGTKDPNSNLQWLVKPLDL